MTAEIFCHTVPTKSFSVWDYIARVRGYREVTQYVVDISRSAGPKKHVAENLQKFGCTILKGALTDNVIQSSSMCIHRIVNALKGCYSFVDDEFVDFDKKLYNIVRMPRIGDGKHNIHFDPEYSDQHFSLCDIAEAGRFSEYLSVYMGRECRLRETGISMTRPKNELRPEGGEGMEWHSDGPNGEATVLLSLDNIDESMGCVRFVPRSHLRYVDGIGHDEVSLSFVRSFLLCQ